ncbi:MAG: hypothetical protein ABJO54_00030 [Hyphomicrobiales bacterium]
MSVVPLLACVVCAFPIVNHWKGDLTTGGDLVGRQLISHQLVDDGPLKERGPELLSGLRNRDGISKGVEDISYLLVAQKLVSGVCVHDARVLLGAS